MKLSSTHYRRLRPGHLEGVGEGIGAAQCFVETGLSEIREVRIVAAAERVLSPAEAAMTRVLSSFRASTNAPE